MLFRLEEEEEEEEVQGTTRVRMSEGEDPREGLRITERVWG